MNVIVSVGGRFHAFDLALQLERRGHLTRLITSYPWLGVRKWGLPREKIVCLPLKELIERSWSRLPFVGGRVNIGYPLRVLFDVQASRHLLPCDIVVAWSSYALRTLRRAKEMGAITIVERGSTHIAYQRDILLEEFQRHGVRGFVPSRSIVRRECTEYSEADYIAIPSTFVKRSFIERGVPAGKLIQVPYGVDLTLFRRVAKEDDKFRVVYAGGMTLRKGVHYLLQAFAELQLPNSELMLLGSKESQIDPWFRRYAGTFKYIGRVPQPRLHYYFSQGSVFVLMSIEEGLALVIPTRVARI